MKSMNTKDIKIISITLVLGVILGFTIALNLSSEATTKYENGAFNEYYNGQPYTVTCLNEDCSKIK